MSLSGDIQGAAGRSPLVSFEFFPPKSAEAEQSLWQTVLRLAPLKPQFVSVTYGAGGSTRERTHATVSRLIAETDLKAAAHLTCVGASRDEVDAIAQRYWDAGVRHIVALRGDPPGGIGGRYEPFPGGYDYAVDLVSGLRKIGDFEISVAAYPETHQHAPSAAFDLDYLKRKIDAGATRAITQCFFSPDVYLRFRDRVRAAGITVPLIPGIMPVMNFKSLLRFAESCSASVPDSMARLFDGLDQDPETRRMVATSWTVDLCRTLQQDGIDEFHFYTLNRAELIVAICHLLGIRTPLSTLTPA